MSTTASKVRPRRPSRLPARSPTTRSTPGCRSGRVRPRLKSTSSCPRARASSTRCRPANDVPPSTSIRIAPVYATARLHLVRSPDAVQPALDRARRRRGQRVAGPGVRAQVVGAAKLARHLGGVLAEDDDVGRAGPNLDPVAEVVSRHAADVHPQWQGHAEERGVAATRGPVLDVERRRAPALLAGTGGTLPI